ncbi:TPR_REGION domain-containing protein [Caenorhabditis elegans]|uniref:TPR_REGION domain-containing protein n=1 Tax=Caenorhabditis elegans TaxID=6239 RepID=U4PBZ1_CAEEL|nr:TPR_REGION domain-containing protein [Caenorhabditis elegans]CDH93387.1 TPR_REGION domain-containing protein [Caenorhabditis elegans]|eukprot:NP_001294584.1 Uncharacterized protein CELE_Y76B12C.6 [Caenorhabditis elegans]
MPDPPKRDPKEPTPLVLMNPELRVRQLRYAANIEASQMVPLARYYEVLIDLSAMGLEYLKSMKLERAFIIFKRIEYFIYHRLLNHTGYKTFESAAKAQIMRRIPMIMYVAQQLIIDFVMPVYERQAAYFRYEELQRRLKILNPDAWRMYMTEFAQREAQFYREAERISTRFGVELQSFLPQEVLPDEHHPSNFPPRTFPVGTLNKPKTNEQMSASRILDAAILAMNTNTNLPPIAGDQPVDTLIRNINSMMNNALTNFFQTKNQEEQERVFREAFPDFMRAMAIPHDKDLVLELPQSADCRNTYSPRVGHMYGVPPGGSAAADALRVPQAEEHRQPGEYQPKQSLDTYIGLLTKTFEHNSADATGYKVLQYQVDHTTSPSTAGFMLFLDPIVPAAVQQASAPPPAPPQLQGIDLATILQSFGAPGAAPQMIPELDPGPPRLGPPTLPLVPPINPVETESSLGVWAKRGGARDGLGSLGLLSELDRARDVLDAVPPLPPGGIHGAQQQQQAVRKRPDSHQQQQSEENRRKRMSTGARSDLGFGGPGPSGSYGPPQ